MEKDFNDSALPAVVGKWKTMMELLMSRVPENEPAAQALEIQTLVQQTLAGDCRAFESLVLRYERRVMSLSVRFLRDLDEAA